MMPDGSLVEVVCTDGLLQNGVCMMKCPLTEVWIERNCYLLEYCGTVLTVSFRNVCFDVA